MKKYILNDNKKILFLKNNEILIDGKNAYRIKLTETDYNNLTEICKKYTIFSKECVSSKLFNKLYSNKIIVEANKNIVESYQNRNERNELFAFNFFLIIHLKNYMIKKFCLLVLVG